MTADKPGSILIVSQVYVPDPASVGQHLADLGSDLFSRGYAVTVFSARRGYDDQSVEFPRSSNVGGVEVRRFSYSSLGKTSMLRRIVGGLFFTFFSTIAGLVKRRVDAVVVSTVPPTAVLAAMLIAKIRRAKFVYWIMDLNPDQAINMGLTSQDSIAARTLHRLNRAAFDRADLLIVLDRFMEDRLRSRYGVTRDILVSPPWAHDQYLEATDRIENPFRSAMGIADRQVVFMYAGNHGESLSLETFLQSADRLRDDDRIVFVFAGGGKGKPVVERFVEHRRLERVHCLPYQPIELLGDLLGAADVHLVTMGEMLVGVNHPCKIYGALAIGRPVLYVGPEPSHMSEIIEGHAIGWQVAHGDVEGVVRAVREAAGMSPADRSRMGQRARALSETAFGRDILMGRISDAVIDVLGTGPRDTRPDRLREQ